MKRIAVGLALGALGMFLLAPSAKAQSWEDMQNDREAIENGYEHLQYDRQELRNDLRNGNYGAAAHEQAEMNWRRASIAERQEDLSNDFANQYFTDDNDGYYGNGHHQWRGHHHHYDEDDNE